MPIYQINLWVCEVCGFSASTTQKTSAYDDPIVAPPEDWDYEMKGDQELLMCPKCRAMKDSA